MDKMKEPLDFKDRIIQKLVEENQILEERNIRLSNVNKYLVERNVEMQTKVGK